MEEERKHPEQESGILSELELENQKLREENERLK